MVLSASSADINSACAECSVVRVCLKTNIIKYKCMTAVIMMFVTPAKISSHQIRISVYPITVVCYRVDFAILIIKSDKS